jgi:hypothetical protein
VIKPRVPLNRPAENTDVGMSRFFNGQNLERYRKLASNVTTAAERQQLLESLAREMAAFKSERKGAAVGSSNYFPQASRGAAQAAAK